MKKILNRAMLHPFGDVVSLLFYLDKHDKKKSIDK